MSDGVTLAGGVAGDSSPADPRIAERIDLRGRTLRQHAVRGTLINSCFRIGMAALGFLRRFLIAAFLTRAEMGIWGILLTSLITLAWLKELGIADKYIQQNEPDQEAAFQKAFTLEVMLSLAFFVVALGALPVYGLAYGQREIVVPGILLALSVPISAFETPILIAYRRMQFVRQRVLSATDPVTALIVTVALGAMGAGYWSLVIGSVAGSVVGGLAATLTSPYKLRWRFERETLRDYVSFSWPLLGYQTSNLVVIQGIMLVGARTLGVAGLGVIGLASAISSFAEGVDGIISETLYPAVCAVAHRLELLHEAFVKSNRLAVMWGMSFGVGLALFAHDLVHYVLGDRWLPAVGTLAAFGLIAGIRQIAFNWAIFMRAVNNTRPMFIVSLGNLASFAMLVVPGLFFLGLTGYAIGMGTAMCIQVLARGYFLRQLFHGFKITPYLARSVLPSIPAAALVLAARFAAGTARGGANVAIELLIYVFSTAAFTWLVERDLLVEIGGYLRGTGGIRTKAARRRATEPDLPRTAPREPSRA